MHRHIFTLGVFMILILPVFGQEASPYKLYGGLQIWTRYTELNPGSSVGIEQYDETFDISVRRYRLGVKGQPYPKLSYNLQIGNNNLSRYQKDQPPKLLDAYVSYSFHENLVLTGGKHAWTGLSRYAAAGTFSAMGADIFFSATPGLNAHDDFFRRLAMALTGRMGKLEYRAVVSKPFIYKSQPQLSGNAVLTDNPTSFTISSYMKYQFLDQESMSSAFSPWTYLGEKEVFNIGAGFTHQSAATESIDVSGDTLKHPMTSFAVDLFYEKPHGSTTWTVYLAYLNHDLGPGFIRYIGANNPANGGVNRLTLNGEGNSFPEAGTGQIYMGQLGFLRAFEHHGIQPNVTVEIADFHALNDLMILWETGVNYVLDGHQSKLSLTYQNRPIFEEGGNGPIVTDRKSMVVLQYQIRF